MNVKEAMALRERIRQDKEKLDAAFSEAWEVLGAAIRPHAMHETNQISFQIGKAPLYSPEELALIRAITAASVLIRAIEVTRGEVAAAGFEAPVGPGSQA